MPNCIQRRPNLAPEKPLRKIPFVGKGARTVLGSCCVNKKGKTDEVLLQKLHARFKPRLAAEASAKYLKLVAPRGWLLRHTQHVCCEYRRWQRRAKNKGGRL